MLQFSAHIAGIDEVGRGCIAGPVIAAVACFAHETLPPWAEEIKDSKKLSPKRRAVLARMIQDYADYGYGAASVTEIDSINIRNASLLAMRRAATQLATVTVPHGFWVDGNCLPHPLPAPADAIIGGDNSHLPIAAASILAKELRDQLMVKLAKRYPAYLWQQNKGYGSQAHREALTRHGISPHHRKSFAPVKNILI